MKIIVDIFRNCPCIAIIAILSVVLTLTVAPIDIKGLGASLRERDISSIDLYLQEYAHSGSNLPVITA